MDEGQRFMRYAVPGIAVAVVFVLALGVVYPKIICWLLDSATPWQAIALMFGGVIASGGLGFLFAQIYFGLPAWFNTPDHSYDALDKNEKKGLKKVESLCRSFCANFWYAGNTKRLKAQRIARRAFLLRWGGISPNKAILENTSRSATRMASLGTTVTGLVILLPVWSFLAFAPSWMKKFNLERNALGATYERVALALGLLCFVLPGFFLLRARHKIREDLEEMVGRVSVGK